MSWEYVKTRSTFQDLWMISPRLKKYVLRTTPRDHVVFDISLKTRRCHGNTSRRGILFKGLSMISPCLKKYVLRTTPRDHVDFEISLRTRRCHENIYQDEEYFSKNFRWYLLVVKHVLLVMTLFWKFFLDEEIPLEYI